MMPLNWFMKKMKEVAEFILKEIDKQKMINNTKYVRKFNQIGVLELLATSIWQRKTSFWQRQKFKKSSVAKSSEYQKSRVAKSSLPNARCQKLYYRTP